MQHAYHSSLDKSSALLVVGGGGGTLSDVCVCVRSCARRCMFYTVCYGIDQLRFQFQPGACVCVREKEGLCVCVCA